MFCERKFSISNKNFHFPKNFRERIGTLSRCFLFLILSFERSGVSVKLDNFAFETHGYPERNYPGLSHAFAGVKF